MNLTWTEPALADRVAIYDHIELENPRAAAELDRQIVHAVERLRRHPKMGRPGRIPGTREFVISRRYILLYELVGDVIHILAVVHTSRQWPPVTPGT